jgi:hypothetical protein
MRRKTAPVIDIRGATSRAVRHRRALSRWIERMLEMVDAGLDHRAEAALSRDGPKLRRVDRGRARPSPRGFHTDEAAAVDAERHRPIGCLAADVGTSCARS